MKKSDEKDLSPSVGDLMSVAIAAAGGSICDFAGRIHCMTDYLAISGARFPTTVTEEEMIAFNRQTLKPVMEEADERARYVAIASFFSKGNGRRAS